MLPPGHWGAQTSLHDKAVDLEDDFDIYVLLFVHFESCFNIYIVAVLS
jgi:hypothetical protein